MDILYKIITALLIGLSGLGASLAWEYTQQDDRLKLEAIGKLPRVVDESSGIVASAKHPGVFWTHNDSGDVARIFPITREGKLLSRTQERGAGIYLVDTRNQDWEALSMDAAGNLLIADVGNNNNKRRNLTIYRIPEPDPQGPSAVLGGEALQVYYPEQTQFPPLLHNFDCEALFVWDGQIHLLTKHRADTRTVLYQLDTSLAQQRFPLLKQGSIDIGGMVCGAEASPDGNSLAILTYNNLWIIDRLPGTPLLQGKYYKGSIFAGQTEAICWENNQTLILTNEQGYLYAINRNQLKPVDTGKMDYRKPGQ